MTVEPVSPPLRPMPAALSLAELVRIARDWVPRLGAHGGSGQPDRRWYVRLERTDDYEVWLLGWNHVQATDFHDHGGSSGAVVVAAGALVERRPVAQGRRAAQRMLRRGETVSFGPEAVHDVTNAGLGPSLSVHAYSPPLESMTYYDLVDGAAVAREVVAVDGPEPEGRSVV